MPSGIYAIVNILTGEQYIGASGNIEDRWLNHSRKLLHGKHNVPFQQAWDTYGSEAFKLTILEELIDPNGLGEREQFYLQQRFETKGSHEYNVAPGGIGRPRTSPRTEVVNFIIATEEMELVRAELARLGAGATIAGWMRDAIQEKLTRDAQLRELYGAGRDRQASVRQNGPFDYPHSPGTPQSGVRRTQQNDHSPQKAPRFDISGD
jgi:group I intron endonuclease